MSVTQKCFYGEFMSAAALWLRLLRSSCKVSDLNHIWDFSRHFHTSPQCQISRKFFLWESRLYMQQTDRHDESNNRFSPLRERSPNAVSKSQKINCISIKTTNREQSLFTVGVKQTPQKQCVGKNSVHEC